jgi:hypothetical protein
LRDASTRADRIDGRGKVRIFSRSRNAEKKSLKKFATSPKNVLQNSAIVVQLQQRWVHCAMPSNLSATKKE